MLRLTTAEARILSGHVPPARRIASRTGPTRAQRAVDAALAEIAGVNLVVPEYRFHARRLWRFDYAIPSWLIGIEIEGVGGPKSRHTTIAGYRADCEKYREAAALGWAVYRFTQDECTARGFRDELRRLIELRRA